MIVYQFVFDRCNLTNESHNDNIIKLVNPVSLCNNIYTKTQLLLFSSVLKNR